MVYSVHLFRHTRRVIGHNIHQRRVRQQLSLAKLSTLTGVSEAMLDCYELGKGVIMIEHMLRIACALGVPAPDLMRELSELSELFEYLNYSNYTYNSYRQCLPCARFYPESL